MPAPRKNWKPTSDGKPPQPFQEPKAQLLLPESFCQIQTVPTWALNIAFKALLGHDNRKIPPDRAQRIIRHLEFVCPYINKLEKLGIQFDREQIIKTAVRGVLTVKPPRHPKEILMLHSKLVDNFLDKTGWPLTVRNPASYELTMAQHLPEVFSTLPSCSSHCPKQVTPFKEDIKRFSLITSRARLRDVIVGFYHGVGADSVRGPRLRHKTRRKAARKGESRY